MSFDVDAYERRSREGPCFVCLIADGDANQRADNEVIFEDDEVLVFLDRYPTVEGYALVCPRRHVEQVTGDFTEAEYVALQRWVHRVGEALRRSVATERLYVLSLGSQHSNRHVHWHVVAQPPGLACGEQQLALLAKSVRGVLPFDPERNQLLAKRIRANLNVL
jgi:diadenosine tetraphosphate (Ap4A) HIT family hydrolase